MRGRPLSWTEGSSLGGWLLWPRCWLHLPRFFSHISVMVESPITHLSFRKLYFFSWLKIQITFKLQYESCPSFWLYNSLFENCLTAKHNYWQCWSWDAWCDDFVTFWQVVTATVLRKKNKTWEKSVFSFLIWDGTLPHFVRNGQKWPGCSSESTGNT